MSETGLPEHQGTHRAGYRRDCPRCRVNDVTLGLAAPPPDRDALATALMTAKWWMYPHDRIESAQALADATLQALEERR